MIKESISSIFNLVLVYLVIWAFVVVLFSAQTMISTDSSWMQVLNHSIAHWAGWILIGPLVLWMAVHFPLINSQRRTKHLIIHGGLSLIATMMVSILFETVLKPTRLGPMNPIHEMRSLHPTSRTDIMTESGSSHRPPPSPPNNSPPFPRRLPSHSEENKALSFLAIALWQLPVGLPVYWTLVGIQSILLFGQQLRKRERKALEIEAKLTTVRLKTLKQQLQPHFLFNTLNAISTLVRRNPDKADEMIGKLSTLLREILEEKDANKVELKRELQLLEAYMDIEKIRFGERLLFEMSIQPECLQAKVPLLLLQPLCETAIRHGLEPLNSTGHLRLVAEREYEYLILRVEDNGVGRLASCTKGHDIGLSNAEARLEALYGIEEFCLMKTERKGGGTVVEIVLPFDTDP